MSGFKKLWHNQFYRENPEEYRELLLQYNSYFRQLNDANQERFLLRLSEFLNSVYFASERGFEIDTKMKVIVSSAFTMITFGLKEYRLIDYDHIFIAPRSYLYHGHKNLLSGDVNTVIKRVSLAWPSVIKGFEIDDDALNIAIHEFGHCLTIENFSRPYINTFFSEKDWMIWVGQAKEKIMDVRNRKNKVIRKYGGTDLMELFAVSLENFFERPVTLKEEMPDMYHSLTKILNQDPINSEDPVL